jgi:hypothetical protein
MVEEEGYEIRLDWVISLFFPTMCVSSVGPPPPSLKPLKGCCIRLSLCLFTMLGLIDINGLTVTESRPPCPSAYLPI